MVIKMEIRAFSEEYRDDLIFMVLQAKDALGRRPRINEDLLDIWDLSVCYPFTGDLV